VLRRPRPPEGLGRFALARGNLLICQRSTAGSTTQYRTAPERRLRLPPDAAWLIARAGPTTRHDARAPTRQASHTALGHPRENAHRVVHTQVQRDSRPGMIAALGGVTRAASTRETAAWMGGSVAHGRESRHRLRGFCGVGGGALAPQRRSPLLGPLDAVGPGPVLGSGWTEMQLRMACRHVSAQERSAAAVSWSAVRNISGTPSPST
jgi:hypothetical protein